jgi:cell division septation protein DedD
MDGFRQDVKAAMNPIYRVQVGAFTDIKNAEAYLKKLKAAGFDGFIK